MDETAHSPLIPAYDPTKPLYTVPALPFLSSAPDPDTGLYIHARDSTVTKVSIPADCLAFQTGEALQIITRGKFRAVPHFVRAGGAVKGGRRVSRNTIAVWVPVPIHLVFSPHLLISIQTFPGLEQLRDFPVPSLSDLRWNENTA